MGNIELVVKSIRKKLSRPLADRADEEVPRLEVPLPDTTFESAVTWGALTQDGVAERGAGGDKLWNAAEALPSLG